jgi:hypothetical protein
MTALKVPPRMTLLHWGPDVGALGPNNDSPHAGAKQFVARTSNRTFVSFAAMS